MRRFQFAIILLSLATIGCRSQSDHAPAIGVAYAGPATLTLRQEINPRSAAAGTAHHGERLEIIQQRRRFFKVRNAKGEEGWTDERLLLTTEEVSRLQRFNQQARAMPSQGSATTYQTLNIHTEPSRFSPSFVQVKAGEKFDVLSHEAAPRKAPPRKPLVAAAPKPATLKKPAKAPKIPPPAAPPAPKPPEDWLALSKTNLPPEEEKKIKEAEPMDDWSLVRTAGGQSGWVLTRLLFMAIPDEVAQYAEGRRITSYFPLGEVHDGDEVKKIWLWTTIEQSLQPYDFDSYRVFVWSLRHHRYETAYIQRRVTGYFPVLVEPPGFSVCVSAAGGRRVRRVYSLNGIAVRPAGEKPCEAQAIEKPPPDAHAMLVARAQEPEQASLYARVKERLRSLRKRWFNR
jgi:uncharacterized protein YgiM (DUF1202 family)